MSRRRVGCRTTLVLLALVALLGAGDAGARVRSTLVVSPGGVVPGSFASIQAAVSVAPSGATILVDPGVYTEQVTINKSLTLLGASSRQAVIKTPTTLTPDTFNLRGLVEIGTAATVTIRGFTIAGPNPTINFGVLVDGGATLTLEDDAITDINQGAANFGVQTGVAVQAGGSGSPALGQVGHVTATGNTLEHYQKAGLLVGRNGSTGDISDNTVIGAGPTPLNWQNGIEVSPGAAAEIVENTVADNSYTGAGSDTASGILLSGAGPVTVDRNTLRENQVGIDLGSQSAHVTVADNELFGGERGVELFKSSGAEILANESVGAVAGGVVAEDSSGNALVRNSAAGAEGANVDCSDNSRGSGSAGTGNTWRGNIAASASPRDICSPGPITTIELHPAAPDGPDGAYTGSVRVTVSASNAGGSEVTGTRCVLDPPTPPTRFHDLPAERCPYLGPGADVNAPGHHTVYAASINAAQVTDAAMRSTSFTTSTPPTPCPEPAAAFDEGFNAAFDSGFNHGFNAGFDSGFDRGFHVGFGRAGGVSADAVAAAALFPACDQPFNLGFDAGFDSGFNGGFNIGWHPGFDSGFSSGFTAGHKVRHA